jgi:3-oxoacyl-[acyl-carrier-protein] synthase III
VKDLTQKKEELKEVLDEMTTRFAKEHNITEQEAKYFIFKGKIKNQKLNKGDVILFASVGAGMNVNAIVYKM